MQYLMSVFNDPAEMGEFGPYASQEEMERSFAQTGAFNESLQERGHLVLVHGLTSPEMAKVVDARSGDAVVTEGPLAQASDYQGGFWVVEVEDEATVLALAAEGSAACGRALEVRPIPG